MLIQHRGEAEYDFRNLLHSSFRAIVETDAEEAIRLTREILHTLGSHLHTAVAGWNQPLPVETFFLASLYTAWTGERHPLLPDVSGRSLSDVDIRLADMALEQMNRR